MATTNSRNNDFNQDLIAKSEKHEQGIEDIKGRLIKLEERVATNEKFAETVCATFDGQSKTQDKMSEIFIKQLKSNPDIQTEIKTFIDKVDREFTNKLFKRIGFAGWSVLIFVAGVVITVIITNTLTPHR